MVELLKSENIHSSGIAISKSKRISYLDYAKGIGIVGVVIGHSFGVLFTPDAHPSDVLMGAFYWIVRWIYAFHMPLFFLISGLFIEKAVHQPFPAFLLDRLRRIAYPYFVWTVIQELLRMVAGLRYEPFSELWQVVYSPLLQFWFLYALFVISVVTVALRKLHVPIWGLLLLTGLLFATKATDLDLGGWSVVYLVRAHWLYFVVGAFLGQRQYLQPLERLTKPVLLWGTATGFGLIWFAIYVDVIVQPLAIALWAAAGIVAALCLARWLELTGAAPYVQTWGMRSLEIYLAHTIFSAAAGMGVQALMPNQFALQVIASAIAGMVGPLLLYRFCREFRLLFLFRLRPAKR
ncbi:MAG: acyltransferase [Cyanobacteria bacterium J06628_6]